MLCIHVIRCNIDKTNEVLAADLGFYLEVIKAKDAERAG